ncbi:MAG: DUF2169 domain-containing protein [Aquabacterium sp.]
MELINGTRMVAGYNLGLEPSGRELLVVVIKGTFVLPKPGQALHLHEAQLPLVMADTFTGEPGLSAPLQEIDFAPRKHRCDVLLTGSAHAPGGRPVTRLQSMLAVGGLRKTIEVVGPRVWQAGLTGIRASDPQPFVQQPLSYDVAFGGVDQASDDPQEHDAYGLNPVGCGFHRQLKNEWVDGRPLPLTEAPGEPVTWPNGSYQPMALGPLGRGWQQRACLAGTYDQQWLDHDFPFLPRDFDERYYQAAPVDQQLPLPAQPLDINLINFTADGLRQFTLPNFEAPVHVFPRRGPREDHLAQLDTIVFEPDEERLSLTWRVTRPLKNSLHEIAQVLVGKRSKTWWRAMHPYESQPEMAAFLPS